MLNLLLQILDEGKIKDSRGNVVRFDHNIIIMTSNIGFHKSNIGFKNSQEDIVNSKLKEILSPEIINRIDEVIIFNKLNYENIYEIVNSKIKEAKEKFKERNISVHISNKVIEEIINDCNYEEFGARKIDKIIRGKIDDIVIDNLILGNDSMVINSIH